MSNVTYQQVKDAEVERLEGFTTKLVREFPPLYTLTEPTFLGAFSFTQRTNKLKFLNESYAVGLGDNFYVTPTDVARTYLRLKYGGERRRMTTMQYDELVHTSHNPPMFAIPGRYSDMVYLDLKSAYWNLLKIVGWDVDYMPGKWLGVNSDNSDYPFADNKVSRSSLLTMGLSKKAQMWTGDKLVSVSTRSAFTNYQVWGVVQDILNGIADDMVGIGAVYVATDGYIIPADKIHEAHAVMESWGNLDYGIKHGGDAFVKSACVYQIGEHQTAHFNLAGIRPTNTIRVKHKDWLRRKIVQFSARKRIDFLFDM